MHAGAGASQRRIAFFSAMSGSATLVALVLALALVALSGCSERRADTMPDFTRCGEDADCSAGYTCRSNVCISERGIVETSTECSSDVECGANFQCLEGRCAADMTRCTDDVECGFDEVCEDGRCRDARSSNACTTSADCAYGVCINRRCQ